MIDEKKLSIAKVHEIRSKKVNQLCGFKIGNGFYAISVLEVQEVIKPQVLTKVPSAPDYVRGLMNLRGQIVTAVPLH